MTPERLAFLTANCPSFATFTRDGPIVHVRLTLAPRVETLTYELKMFLDGFAAPMTHNPAPLRHYEIWCEDAIISVGTY